MRENILNMPHHLKRQRVVSAEQAAMAMTGVYHLRRFSEFDKEKEPEIYNAILSYLNIVLAALDEGLVAKSKWSDIAGNITGAEFYAEDIWPWALNELSQPEFIFSIEKNQNKIIEDNKNSLSWGDFAGRETALKLIAGMAIALEKTGGKYVRGGSLNKSEVARTASAHILKHGYGIDRTSKAMTDLIKSALDLYASKND